MIAHDLSNGGRSSDVKTASGKSTDFDSFLLSTAVLKGLKKCGFVRPSPIQVEAIPLAKCGIDLVCQAKSGTGKTCVLAVCCLETIDVKCNKVQALILAPTREIAHQIHGVVTAIGCFVEHLQCKLFIGGINMATDMENLKNCHVAIGTPGRVKSLLENGYLSPSAIRLFILDEADKLLEKGSFEQQINWIYSTLPEDKQMLALSATYPKSLGDNLDHYMRSPMHVKIDPKDVSLLGVVQFKCHVKHHSLPNKLFQEKLKILTEILKKLPFQQCMVFSNYHSRAEQLSKTLIKLGWPSTHIAGSQMQKDRLEAIDQLKSFKCRILITTDLTSRGIDCDKVNLVINLDIPWDVETYLHRIGRAGRYGSRGVAISLVSEAGEEMTRLTNISANISRSLIPLPDFSGLDTLWNNLSCYSNLQTNTVGSKKEDGGGGTQKTSTEGHSSGDKTDCDESTENKEDSDETLANHLEDKLCFGDDLGSCCSVVPVLFTDENSGEKELDQREETVQTQKLNTDSTHTSIDTIDCAMIQHNLNVESSNFNVESSNFNVEHHISNKNVESTELMNNVKVECPNSNVGDSIDSPKYCVEFKPYDKSKMFIENENGNLKGDQFTPKPLSKDDDLSESGNRSEFVNKESNTDGVLKCVEEDRNAYQNTNERTERFNQNAFEKYFARAYYEQLKRVHHF